MLAGEYQYSLLKMQDSSMQVLLFLSYQKMKVFSIKRKIVKHCFKLLEK